MAAIMLLRFLMLSEMNTCSIRVQHVPCNQEKSLSFRTLSDSLNRLYTSSLHPTIDARDVKSTKVTSGIIYMLLCLVDIPVA